MEKRKHRSLNLKLFERLKQDNKPIILEFERIENSTFEIPDLIHLGDPLLYVKVEDFIGVIPFNEFSIQKQKPNQKSIGKTKLGYVHSEYEFESEDGSKTLLVVFSTKAYEQEIKGGAIEEITSSESIPAEVVFFTEYSAILKYKGVMMELTNHNFSQKSVSIDAILAIGDVIDVKFKKFRNNGRKIMVDPVIPFPLPSYRQPIDINSIEPQSVYMGEIKHIKPNSIIVSIGRNVENGNNTPINVVCQHPHPAVSQYLSKEIPVKIKIRNVRGSKITGSIIDINIDFVDDSIFEYRRALDEAHPLDEREVAYA